MYYFSWLLREAILVRLGIILAGSERMSLSHDPKGRRMKRIFGAAGLVTLAAILAGPAVASAAAPDAAGQWADSVVSTTQGPRGDGSAVLPERSNPTAALGVAERTDAPGTFYSLGFGGKVTLSFKNSICNAPGPDVAVEVVEATSGPYPQELVDVYVSLDGKTFVKAASSVSNDSAIDLPDSVPVARYVKLVDVSDRSAFEPTADGYDVDGVRALQTNCTTDGRMTGGGLHRSGYDKVSHGFTLSCGGSKPNVLVVNWKHGLFILDKLGIAYCTDDAAIDPGHPLAPFDTFRGIGTGKVNGKSGYNVDFTFVDAGEPGRNDTSQIRITNASTGAVVLDLPTTVLGGNHQAHR
jgi:hypothetical protein